MPNLSGTTSSKTSDRVVGALLVVLALVIALESRNFTVGFVTDPLGPKAFPLVSGGLLLIGGVTLLVRPGSLSEWPGAQQLLRVAEGAAFLFAYALLLGTLGFFTTTTLLIVAFSLQLGGRPIPALCTAAGISAALYVLFYHLLDIALPIGSLFLRGG